MTGLGMHRFSSAIGLGPADQVSYLSRQKELCLLEMENHTRMVFNIRKARDRAMQKARVDSALMEEVKAEIQWRLEQLDYLRDRVYLLRVQIKEWTDRQLIRTRTAPQALMEPYEGAVQVGKGTPYANPFAPSKQTHQAREYAATQYRYHFFSDSALVERAVLELRGKHLYGGEHAKVLVEAANRLETGRKQIPTWVGKVGLQSL
jgi:hypothetical protein